MDLYNLYINKYRKLGASFEDDRCIIRLKNIELHAKKDIYVAFTMSNIYQQSELDYINNKYSVSAHFGKNYAKIVWDISKCNRETKSKDPCYDKCYFSCNNMTEESSIELFDYLLRINLFNI